MRSVSRWALLVLIPLLCIAGVAGDAQAQWTIAAPNLLKATDTTGAMQFHNGILWAGGNELWSSLDSGRTWQKNVAFPNALISDIAFYDKLHGMVATLDMGFFFTINGGLSWLQKDPPSPGTHRSFVKVGYVGSNSILLAPTIDGQFYISPDGGVTWNNPISSGNNSVNSFAVAEDGAIYADGVSGSSGSAFHSTDLGQTWSATTGTYNNDAWSISADSCDPKRLYLANEEWQETGNTSNFYLSTDGGQSWQSTDSHAAPYLSGAMSTTTDGIFLGTTDGSGIHRSMDRGLTWKNIGGPNIKQDTRNLATVNDNFVLATDTSGTIWVTMNGGGGIGDSVASAPAGTINFDSTRLFTTDTLTCNPIQRSMQIVRTGCPVPYLLFSVLGGPDSASYEIDSTTHDSIYISFLPQKNGANNALLIGHRDDGTFDTVHLSGFVSQYSGAFTMSPDSLFANDTLKCDSLTLPAALKFSGCRPPSLLHIGIIGPDAGSFHITDSTNDSLHLLWSSQKPGTQHAWIVAQLSNGQSDTVVVLGGFSATDSLAYSYAPHNLFTTDTLFVACSPVQSAKINFYDTDCIWPTVTSEHISGPDSADYTISDSIVSPITALDSVTIQFFPKDTGLRSAVYEIMLNDGTIITVPLSGVGIAQHILSPTSSNEKMDTIGGTVGVPITINGLERAETIEMVIHYQAPDLVYDSSVDTRGVKVDVPGEQWSGRSLLRIPNAQPGTVTAYARFNVFSDTNYDPLVTFDSVTVPSEFAACEYVLPVPITDTIFPIEGCSIPILSQFVHLNKFPTFNVEPNPSSGTIQLASSLDLGNVWIEVYDMLGSERGQFSATLTKNAPATLSLPFENGLYFLRIVSSVDDENLTVIINK
jgi:photosystem II stability/assembly factor-like uncharacterized protein